jgi:glycosyltransferase involved in cell wall biosynthesis
MPIYCRRATHIIAVSEQTRRDLVAVYGLSPEKVTVIHEAAAPSFCPQPPETVVATRAQYKLPDRYLLFVGTIEPRKNLARLLAAFEAVHSEALVDGLVIVGRRGWLYDDFFAALERSPARDAVIFPGYLPDADLPAVYAGAEALVLPSLYEGFGLPVLEAMACGTPVVCSNAASIPEIGGDAALYFDPTSTEAMVAVIRRVLRDAALQAEMKTRGLAQATRFSWRRAAQETLGVYERTIGHAGLHLQPGHI